MPRLMSASFGAILAVSALLAAPPALAQVEAAAPSGAITLELNNAADIAQPGADGAEASPATACRMTYVVTNRSGQSLSAATWQVGIFDSASVVRALLLLGFGELPIGKTKIGVFDIPDWPCSDISRIIVNDVAECTPTAAAATGSDGQLQSNVCLEGLTTSSRSEIEFGL